MMMMIIMMIMIKTPFMFHNVSPVWCWRRMEKVSWTDHGRNEDVLLRVKEQRNILHENVNGRRTGLVTFCVETAFYNRLLKERYKGV